MKFQRFMLFNILFVAWFVLAAVVAVLPELVGVSSDAPRLPDAVRGASETEPLSQPLSKPEPVPEIVKPHKPLSPSKFGSSSLELPSKASPELTPEPEIQKLFIVSISYEEVAEDWQRKQFQEALDASYAEVDEPELVELEEPSPRKLSAALVYLRDYQTDAGEWKAGTWWPEVREGAFSNDRETSHETEFGWESDTVANTSLALLAYLSAGWDHTDGPYQATFLKALKYLRRIQQSNGQFSEDIKHHSLAVMAMSEAYGLSGQAILGRLAGRGIDYIIKQQHDDGGFGNNGASNVIDSCYAVLAIKSARMSGLEPDKKAAERAFAYMESMRDGDHVRFSAYREFPEQAGNFTDANFPTCEAAWILSGLFSNKLTIRDKTVRSMADRLVEKQNLPDWKANNIDCEYYWIASKALFQKGGKQFKSWKKALSTQLYDRQRGYTEYDKESELISAKQLLEYGSWDPAGVNGPRYGRVFTTCMCYLALERTCGYYYQSKYEEPTEDVRIVDDPIEGESDGPSDVPREDLAANQNQTEDHRHVPEE
ncbi:MAG: terpene cyclase/mutase family protein [Planctomycetes bacterium]|nr:terpene cyclase/mutase family protein [Planctomycetota bacterium]